MRWDKGLPRKVAGMCGKWTGCFPTCKPLLTPFKNGFIRCKWEGTGGPALVSGGNAKLSGLGPALKDGGFCSTYSAGALLKKKRGLISPVGSDHPCLLSPDLFIVGLLISVEFFTVILFVLLLMVVIGLNGLFAVARVAKLLSSPGLA